VYTCFPKQFSTVASIVFYLSVSILWVLEGGFKQVLQIFLTIVIALFLVIVWRKEIYNKLRSIN
jgi:hypothetical protein